MAGAVVHRADLSHGAQCSLPPSLPTDRPLAVCRVQVLIRVHACGVNPVETYVRSGNYAWKPTLPYTPGADVAGVVERVGEGVTSVKVHVQLLSFQHFISPTVGTDMLQMR